METVKPQTNWGSVDGKKFTVIHVIEDNEGHTWVHYRNQQGHDILSIDRMRY